MIATVDGARGIEEFVTSGFTPAEEAELVAWLDRPQLFEHFRSLAAPIRVGNLPVHVRALGFSSDPMRSRTMSGAPPRHRDINVGNFFRPEREGGRKLTNADEEVPTLFAAQAATAVANARAHGTGRSGDPHRRCRDPPSQDSRSGAAETRRVSMSTSWNCWCRTEEARCLSSRSEISCSTSAALVSASSHARRS